MKLCLEKAPIKEINSILQMLKDAAQWLKSENIDYWTHWLEPNDADIRQVSEDIKNEKFYLVKNGDGVIVGMFKLQYADKLLWEDDSVKAGYIHLFTISRTYKNEGLGYKTLDMVKAMLINENIFCLRLDCGYDNKKLCKYYEEYGFKLIAVKKIHEDFISLYEKILK